MRSYNSIGMAHRCATAPSTAPERPGCAARCNQGRRRWSMETTSASGAELAAPKHVALGLDREQLLELYDTMLQARILDQKMWVLNRQGKAAFVISCQGQEAAQVGSAYA